MRDDPGCARDFGLDRSGRDRFLQSNNLRLLMSAARRGDLRVGISEVTLREAVNKVREDAAEALDKIASGGATLRRLRFPTADFITELTADWVAEDYERFLRQELDRHRVQILEIPAISHEAVVARALMRQKPFDSKGHSGYRDALIWETIRDLANRSSEEVAFISANHRDFAQERRAGAPLAQNLVEELRETATVKLWHSVEVFVDEHVRPAADVVAELGRRLDDDTNFRTPSSRKSKPRWNPTTQTCPGSTRGPWWTSTTLNTRSRRRSSGSWRRKQLALRS